MIELERDVIDFLREAGARPRQRAEGLYWGDYEVGSLITDREGTCEIARWERGRTGPERLTGATPAVVSAHLVLTWGQSWRIKHGLPVLRRVTPETVLPPGFEITGEETGDVGLIVPGEPPLHLRGVGHNIEALALARALSVPVRDLIASFKHPDGLPAFEGAETL